jgi:hypothetical protein
MISNESILLCASDLADFCLKLSDPLVLLSETLPQTLALLYQKVESDPLALLGGMCQLFQEEAVAQLRKSLHQALQFCLSALKLQG